MAKHNRKRAKTVRRHATANRRRRYTTNARHRRRNPGRRTVVVVKRANRRRRNPMLGTSNISAGKLAAYIVVGAIGTGVNKLVTNMLPTSLTSSTMGKVLSSAAVAAAEWYLGSMVNREYGPFLGFGGAMNTVSEALTSYVPSIASSVGISGMGRRQRGIGDLVPGTLLEPYNPFLNQIGGGVPANGTIGADAYPAAYPGM